MKTGKSFGQCYNAQAAVDVETMLIVGQHVTDQANDRQQLLPTLAAVSPAAGAVGGVLVDSGYFSSEAVIEAEDGPAKDGQGPRVYAAMKRQRHGRRIGKHAGNHFGVEKTGAMNRRQGICKRYRARAREKIAT